MKKIILYIIVALGITAGLYLFGGFAQMEKNGGGAPASVVNYMRIKQETVYVSKEFPGRVSALIMSEVRPQVNGIILERLFTEGADVKEGDILYRIDPKIYKAAYDNAEANLAKANANETSTRLLAERYAKLIKTNSISRQEYDDAQAAHDQAKADIKAAQGAFDAAIINLEYTEVKAPVSGRIGRSHVTVGALVTQNQPQPLASIQKIDQVYVDVTTSSYDLLQLRKNLASGQYKSKGDEQVKVKLRLEDGSFYSKLASYAKDNNAPELIRGEMLFSDVTVEQTTGSINIRVKFDNPENVLLPGMYVKATLNGIVRENSVLIPQKTVHRDNRGGAMAYVLTKTTDEQNSKVLAEDEYYVARKMIELGDSYGNKWLVLSGLEDSDLLLIDGAQKVSPGQVVKGNEIIEMKEE